MTGDTEALTASSSTRKADSSWRRASTSPILPTKPRISRRPGSTSFRPRADFDLDPHPPRDECTNRAFGGDDLKTLYVTAGGSL